MKKAECTLCGREMSVHGRNEKYYICNNNICGWAIPKEYYDKMMKKISQKALEEALWGQWDA